MNFLESITGRKKVEVEEAKKKLSFSALKEIVRDVRPENDFKKAITRKNGGPVKVVAEFKRASPSKGVIAENVDPVGLAKDYKSGGASAISILTEKNFFKGSALDLRNVRDAVPDVPILRKDFIVDEYQIYESIQIGADAILLIVAALDESELKNFASVAKGLGLNSLVEVHCEEELDIALSVGAEIIGVNNRDLVTFEVSTGISERLSKNIPTGIVSVSESGIGDISGLRGALETGYHAVLIGEHFMRAKDRVTELKKFTSFRSGHSA